MNGTGSKSAFGPGMGIGHEFGLKMFSEGVSPSMFKLAVSDPIRRASVGAALRGEISLATISPEDWIVRERVVGESLAELGLPMFDQGDVVKAAEKGVGIYDRFVPSLPKETARKQLLKACERAGVKLYTGNSKDGDYDGERIATVAGVFALDYASIFKPTNAEQHPYVLPYDQQMGWATEQGGDGFSTAEEAIYMAILRPKVEIGFLPYIGGYIRCQNTCDSGDSLGVYWSAGNGLRVSRWYRSGAGWLLWALPRKFRALGA